MGDIRRNQENSSKIVVPLSEESIFSDDSKRSLCTQQGKFARSPI